MMTLCDGCNTTRPRHHDGWASITDINGVTWTYCPACADKHFPPSLWRS